MGDFATLNLISRQGGGRHEGLYSLPTGPLFAWKYLQVGIRPALIKMGYVKYIHNKITTHPPAQQKEPEDSERDANCFIYLRPIVKSVIFFTLHFAISYAFGLKGHSNKSKIVYCKQVIRSCCIPRFNCR